MSSLYICAARERSRSEIEKEYKMKVTIIHGQSHKGSTYHISKILADKIGGEVKEFFLPRDFGEFCIDVHNVFVNPRHYVHIMKRSIH